MGRIASWKRLNKSSAAVRQGGRKPAGTRPVTGRLPESIQCNLIITEASSVFDQWDLFMQQRGRIVTVLLHVLRHALLLRRHQRLLLGFSGGMLGLGHN